MAGTDPLYYWDTCIFLAWLKDEERKAGEMAGVREVIEKNRKREVRLMTSVLTLTEVLASKIPVGLENLYKGLIMRRVNRIGMDIKVAQLAHDIRDYYAQRATENGGKILSTPDAIHLATAILYRADEFHTFDEEGGRKTLGLLPLSGNVAGHGLKICKPEGKNLELDLRRKPEV